MPVVVVLEDDLLFLSRIREAAKGSPAVLRVVRSAAALVEACRAEPPTVVLADLDSPRLGALDAIRAMQAEPRLASIPIVGFFSHVHLERSREAHEAGCSKILARSAFVQALPALLSAAPRAEKT